MRSRGAKLIVTAGPTREAIDPVRFITNHSTGKMGFAVARAGAAAGFDVTLIAGPVSLKTPKGVRRVDVVSAREMLASSVLALRSSGSGDLFFVSTAAVADWRPKKCASKKIKKSSASAVLELVRNPDILKTLAAHRAKGLLPRKLKLVGFAAETGSPAAEAARKCRDKGLEFVVGNDVTKPGCGFGVSTNQVVIAFRDGRVENTGLMSKNLLAKKIIEYLK